MPGGGGVRLTPVKYEPSECVMAKGVKAVSPIGPPLLLGYLTLAGTNDSSNVKQKSSPSRKLLSVASKSGKGLFVGWCSSASRRDRISSRSACAFDDG